MKNLLALLAVLVSAISLHAQVVQVVVSGSVRDAETGEALAGASVYTKDYRYGQITDNVTAKPFLKGVCKLPFLPSVDYTIKF